MTARQLLVPAYLFACLVLGGSTQNLWFNALLQLCAVAILTWAAIAGPVDAVPRHGRWLGMLVAAMLALVALHILPLPPALWSALPGRGMVRDGLDVLGLAPGWQSLSLAPYDSLSAALPLLPPLAMLAAMFVPRAFSRSGIAIVLVAVAVLGLALGLLQVASPLDSQAQFYLQAEVNPGTPSGFFANPNHLATLLLVALPFCAALAVGGPGGDQHARQRRVIGGAGAAVIVAGLVFNRSLAGLGLLVPIALASLAMVVRLPAWTGRVVAGAFAVAAFALALLLASPAGRAMIDRQTGNSLSTRYEFLTTSLATARDYAPIGSGFGTFARVYAMKEDPRRSDPTAFVNHAHDDYLELWVETGAPGLALVLLFLGWWGLAVRRMMRAPASDRFARAGAIASGAVLLHSLVDFPLRNSAIAASFAVCIALIVLSRNSARGPTDLRPTRHMVID